MNNDEKKQRIKEAVDFLIDYMGGYTEQYFYEEYSDKILMDDVLYGLGVALGGEKYMFRDGYERFKEDVLIPHLTRTDE